MTIPKTYLISIFSAVVLGAMSVYAQQVDNPLEASVRPFTPQVVIDAANHHRGVDGRADNIFVSAVQADLAGTGKFDFIVASYSAGFYIGDLLVLKDTGSQLTVAFDAGPSRKFSGRVDISAVDIFGDGKEQIQYISHGANRHFSLDIFQWTGTVLRSIVSDDDDTEDAELIDVEGDGVLEIVTPGRDENGDPTNPGPIVIPYKVYKFNGSQFVLAFTSPIDPTGRVSTDGQTNQSVYGRTRIEPDHFSAAQIRKSTEKHESEEGEVLVRLGNLFAPVDATPGPVSAENFDLTSFVLGRAIHPLKVEIVHGDDADGGDSDSHGNSFGQQNDQGTQPPKIQGQFVQAHFSREAVLQFLPRTQLNKPLSPGDTLTLGLRGKMKNGAPVFSVVKVTITSGDAHDHQ